MTSIIRRLVLLLKAWWHALMAPAEDPRQVYEAVHSKQEQLLAKVREARSKVAASRRYLAGKIVESGEKLPQLEDQARQALQGGKEEVARFALRLRYTAQEELESLEKQSEELEQEEWVLDLVEQRLGVQIDSFQARQQAMVAQYSTAEAQVTVHEALGGLTEEMAGLGQALERAEQRTEDMQAKVSAIDGLVELGLLESPTQVFGELTAMVSPAETEDVEDRLRGLKRELSVD